MFDFKACTVCLSTNVHLKSLDNGNLREEFNSFSGLKTRKGNGLPSYLCVVCVAILKKTKHFRERCQRANYTLQEILLRNGEITETNIQAINKASLGIAPSLSIIERNKASYEVVQFPVQSKNYRKSSPIVKNISILHFSINNSDSNDLPAYVTTRQDTNSTIQEKPQEPPAKKTKIFEDKNVKIEIMEAKNNFDNISFEQISYDSKTEKQYFEESTSNVHDDAMDNYFDDDHGDDDDNIDLDAFASTAECKLEKPTDTKVVGSNLEEEYAVMIPISLKEAKAAVEVYNMFGTGRCKCNICGKAFMTDKRLKIHTRMHDKHISGLYYCELCSYYYKTEYLLNSHITEKHTYKYVCRKCPEVNFDRMSAKQHFIWNHLQSGTKRDANWYESRPTWLSTRGGKRVKGLATIRPVKKVTELPSDFLKYSAVTPLEQYELIRERRSTRNYIESPHKCELCYRGFRELVTYSKHMKKHDPSHSGPLQCDMCKLHFKSARHVYRHMIITHLARYSCQVCDFVCYNKGQANQHYRWHNNVTYACTQCDKVFKKHTTRLTHMRIKHPTTELCNICGHSFVSEAGLYFHKRKAHNSEEIEAGADVKVELESCLYCEECQVQFLSDAAFATHLGSSSKHAATNLSIQNNALGNKRRRENTSRRADGKVRQSRSKRASDEIINNGLATGTDCEVCGVRLSNDVQARKHYASEHPGTEFLKRYMCDVCGHTTKQYANLLVHMRTHTREKPYSCPHCDRRFSMPSNRDRHLVVHTGEKRYECEHCHRRFTQSSAVKLHIQTVHLKIPYAPWDKKNRKRRKDAETAIVPPQPKLMLDATGEYINAYITYNDDV